MSIFQPATNTSAFLKMGIMGKQGAGKTKTAGKVAIGLVQHLQKMGVGYASKPVAMFDTETGSDYLIPDFKAANIPFVVAKTKTLADLLKGMDEAEKNCSVLIIDSITHPYRELIAAYLKSKNRTFLQIDDWNYLKGEYGWAQFTKRYINSNLHIIMCGRAGDDLEQYVDENGKRQLEKIGVKMKTEAETGFEPSLLVLMELVERRDRIGQAGSKRTFVNRATIVKDRWDAIMGDMIDDPDFIDFLPHISRLALGGAHVGVRDTGDSQHILKTERRDWSPVQRKIVLGEIQDLLVLHVPGRAVAEQQRKVGLIKKHFGVGWVEAEEVMPVEDLRAGYDSLHRELEGAPSKYTAIVKAESASAGMNDSLPDHSAKPATTEPTVQHASDCAVHNEPAMPNGPCNCGAASKELEQKLLADLPNNGTPNDCLNWMVGVTNHHRATLGEDAFARINAALIEHQAKLAKAAEAAKKDDTKPDDPKPGNGDGGGEKADLTKLDPATDAPAFLTRDPDDKAAKPGKGSGKGKARVESNATEADAYMMSA